MVNASDFLSAMERVMLYYNRAKAYALEKVNLSGIELSLLAEAVRNPGATLQTLAEKLSLTLSAASEVVSSLVDVEHGGAAELTESHDHRMVQPAVRGVFILGHFQVGSHPRDGVHPLHLVFTLVVDPITEMCIKPYADRDAGAAADTLHDGRSGDGRRDFWGVQRARSRDSVMVSQPAHFGVRPEALLKVEEAREVLLDHFVLLGHSLRRFMPELGRGGFWAKRETLEELGDLLVVERTEGGLSGAKNLHKIFVLRRAEG